MRARGRCLADVLSQPLFKCQFESTFPEPATTTIVTMTAPRNVFAEGAHEKRDTGQLLRNWSTRRGSAISVAIRTSANSLIVVCQVPWASQNELVGRHVTWAPQKIRMVLPGVGDRSYASAKQLRAGFGSQSV